MPRKTTQTTQASETGALALARKASVKALKKDESQWRVVMDDSMLQESLPHIPTGSIIIDYLIGGERNERGVMPCPGIPRGRITQLWGHESAGKSTLALTAAATCCAQGGTVLFVDWENAIVPDYAAALGVPVTDPNKFELVQPDTLEDGLKLAQIYALAGVDLIIFDSVGAAVPARIANRDLGEVGEQARVGELQAVWSQELPNLRGAAAKRGAAILGISQIRAKISTGPSYGPQTQPQGGNAWKFYSDVRIELRRVKTEKSNLFDALTNTKDQRITGGLINCKLIKCKISSSQGREGRFYIRHGEGIDDIRSVMELATKYKLIKKAGSWLTWETPGGEEIKCQGTDKLRDHLKENPSDFRVLVNAVTPYLSTFKAEDDEFEEYGDDGVDALLAEASSMSGKSKSDDGDEGEDEEGYDEDSDE